MGSLQPVLVHLFPTLFNAGRLARRTNILSRSPITLILLQDVENDLARTINLFLPRIMARLLRVQGRRYQ
jgi:hypothetical protein